MSKQKTFKTALLTLCMVLLMSAAAAAGEIATSVGCITGEGVRMRAESNTSSTIVTLVPKGSAISVLGEENGWYKVSLDGENGYIRKDLMILDQDGIFSSHGIINAASVNIRSGASTDSAYTGSVGSGAYVKVNGFTGGWYSIETASGTKGYVRSDLMDLTIKPDPAAAPANDAAAPVGSGNTSIVATAQQYLGTPYVYGGASTGGFDCSGFTMYIYGKFGVSLPHSATSQWQSGLGTRIYSASGLQAGDLVFFCDPSRSNGKACSHAGIYIGGGQFIHASSSRNGGVIISSLNNGYYDTYFVGGLHIL